VAASNTTTTDKVFNMDDLLNPVPNPPHHTIRPDQYPQSDVF